MRIGRSLRSSTKSFFQEVIGSGDLLETLLTPLVSIWMIALREYVVVLPELLLIDGLLKLQDLVAALLGERHGVPPEDRRERRRCPTLVDRSSDQLRD